VAERGLAVHDLRVSIACSRILTDVSLTVGPGEVVAVVGPSGCGKTTLLRAIAGLLTPETGRVTWEGRDITGVAPHRRSVGLMFQEHALFPHRTVGENVAFGLRMQGVGEPARTARVDELLDRVGLAGFAPRRVASLSGGEAQRVALARALAPRPAVLLLDEPLGSLDRERREQLASDLRAILTSTGTTALHVTHDQDEAVTVADRLAVMLGGRLRQVGTPAAVRAAPVDAEVARQLGVDTELTAALAKRLGLSTATRFLTPEQLQVGPGPLADHTAGVAGTVVGVVYRAGRFVHRIRLEEGVLAATADQRYEAGTAVTVTPARADPPR
jgi:thiamine transport system ATP-binding protein